MKNFFGDWMCIQFGLATPHATLVLSRENDMPQSSDNTTTRVIVTALTRAIVEHRLHPGTKLAEQKLADHFGVSRTLVRQALFQLVQRKLIRMEPSRGAFVASPSSEEARQVFAVRRRSEEHTSELQSH